MVRSAGGRLRVRDLGSRNGTVVNAIDIEQGEVELASGDVIWLGDEKLEVVTRASRDVQPTWDDSIEDPATVTERNAIGLVEEMVARAAETGERTAVAPAIQEMIDALIESSAKMGHRFGSRESIRLLAAASVVAGWFNDGSLDGWSHGVRRQVEGH